MVIGIHQPNFFPWMGYFEKMAKCDVFVLLDNVQYEKDSYINRVKIKTPKGEKWLTFPIKNKFPQLIKDVEFADFGRGKEKILKTIEANYKKSKNFEAIFPIIQGMFQGDWKSLSGFNIYVIRLLARGLRNQPEIKIASQYDFEGKSTDLLINICKRFGTNNYLSGSGGVNYQEEEKFKKAGIKLTYTDYVQKPYKQLWGEFIGGLSILDYLFNNEHL